MIITGHINKYKNAMKKGLLFIFLLSALFNSKNTFSQQIEKADSLGLPGDNLNLYSVLDLFQKSETFEIFEKQLNLEDSKINNLDLNNDDKTDYIKVVDHQTGEAHAVVLQVLVNEKETQDVAVIEIDKDKNGKVLVQIVGDEDLYGKNYIVEPTENDPTAKTADPNKKSDTTVSADGKTTVINNTTNNYNTSDNNSDGTTTYVTVNRWPIVRYVYAPAYVVYVSPWYWHYYPSWWNPWSPWYWHSYYWHHHSYYNHHHHYYHRSNYYRSSTAHGYYGSHRTSSATVQSHRKANDYSRTYASKDRKGDGKIVKPATSNPAYDNKSDNRGNGKGSNNAAPKGNNNTAPKGNDNAAPKGDRNGNSGSYNKPPKSNGSPSVKPNKPSGSGRKINSTPRGSNKPAVKPGGGSGVKKGGGGGRR
jgi:hypothetical protein